MLRLTETGSALVLTNPAWLGVLVLLLGVVLGAYVARGKAPAGKALGAGVAALVLLYAGWHFLRYKATLDAAGVRERTGLGEQRMAWVEVESAGVEERSQSRGGRATVLALRTGTGSEITIKLGGLAAADAVRVIEFARARAGKP